MDKQKIAADLRLEATKLQEEARQLQQAADVLDPLPRQSLLPVPSSSTWVNRQPEVIEDDRKTIVDLAVAVLKKAARALRKDELFDQVQTRGGQVANLESFSSALSRAKDKVVPVGNGLWDLRERHVEDESLASGADTISANVSAELIRLYLRKRNARVHDVARHFQTTDEIIKKLISDPASGIKINGPGWLKAAPPLHEPDTFSDSGR